MTSALDPFRRWAELPNLAVLDSETTGLHGEIIELAIVDGAGQPLFNERIRPTCPVEPGAQAIHGISDADLEGLPSIAAHWPRLSEIFLNHHLVIYNRNFDLGRLKCSMTAAQPTWMDSVSDQYLAWHHLHTTSECVMEAYAPIYGWWNDYHRSYRWAKLTDACATEKVKTDDLDAAHSAVGDCLRTLRLVHAVAQRTDDLALAGEG